MPSVCTFVFNKKNPVYYGGETITAKIRLETTVDKNVREVSIMFLGESKVKWEESDSTSNSDDSTSTSTTYFTSCITHVKNRAVVIGDGILKAGVYEFAFTIDLPLECPTSCEGVDGHTRYEISLKINRYYRFNNIYKQAVTIIRERDLNLSPIYRLPIEMEAFSSSCWSCFSGKLYCTLKIPYGAYVCGQTVKYVLYISNQSMHDTEGYNIKFRKIITYTAESPQKKSRRSKHVLLNRTSAEKCLHQSNRVLEGAFLIPATPPSSQQWNVVYVEYELKVTVLILACNSGIDLKVPVVIGTIPIRESVPREQTLKSSEKQLKPPTAPEISKEDCDVTDGNERDCYNELSPPTYEEAARNSAHFIDTDVDEINRIVDFRPLYPVHNMTSSKKL